MGADAFGTLNDGERRVLALLAAGHTAKSIAAELDLSVNAVNERLREARRKTGASSSRELARALGIGRPAQENRDKFVGVAGPRPTGDAVDAGTTHRAWLRIGAPLMILAVLLAAAILHPQQALRVDDPLLGELLARAGPDASTLHARVRAEPRDVGAEAFLLNSYGALRDLRGATFLRVTCGQSRCEVAGRMPRTRPLDAVQKLGNTEMVSQGYRSSTFAVGDDGSGAHVFVTYLDRVR